MFKEKFSKDLKSLYKTLGWILIPVLVIAALVGCGGSIPNNLLGKWEMTSKYSAFSYYLIAAIDPGEILEFRSNGEVVIGSYITQYQIEENNRLRVKGSFGDTLYEFKINGDDLTIQELGQPDLVMKFRRK